MPDPGHIFSAPHRTRRERMLDRVQVAGAVLIALALLAAAVATLL